MTIELRLKGREQQWTLSGEHLRLGRGASCEAALPATEYPMVSREHARLEASDGGWKLVDLQSANGSYVNGERVSERRLAPGDVIRLGANGPEILVDWRPAAEARTVVGQFNAVDNDARTVVAPSSAAAENKTLIAPIDAIEARTMIGSAPQGEAKTMIGQIAPERDLSSAILDEAPTIRQEARTMIGQIPGEAKTMVGQISDDLESVRVSFPQAAPAAAKPAQEKIPAVTYKPLAPEEDPMIENKINALRGLVLTQLVVIAVLLIALLYSVQQVNKTRDEVVELRKQAGDAVQQFTPQLDDRIKQIDAKLGDFDSKSKQAEDHFVQRINTELPVMLDKYIDKKVKTAKTEHPELHQ